MSHYKSIGYRTLQSYMAHIYAKAKRLKIEAFQIASAHPAMDTAYSTIGSVKRDILIETRHLALIYARSCEWRGKRQLSRHDKHVHNKILNMFRAIYARMGETIE